MDIYDELVNLIKNSPIVLALPFFLLALACLLNLLGFTPGGLQVKALFIPPPSNRRNKLISGALGTFFILVGIACVVILVDYKPSFTETEIYEDNDAKQIVVDGEDIYILKRNGNVLRISEEESKPVVYNRDHTKEADKAEQIASTGGVFYILQQSGNIQANATVLGRVGQEVPLSERLIDDGTGTKQIVSTGDTLYVLKNNGNIWRRYNLPTGNDQNANDDPYPVVVSFNKWERIDNGTNTRQITSSGAVLYILKESGNIWQYAPTINSELQEIYKKRDAESIKADGGTLYFIKNDGATWKFKDRPIPSTIENKIRAKKNRRFQWFCLYSHV